MLITLTSGMALGQSTNMTRVKALKERRNSCPVELAANDIIREAIAQAQAVKESARAKSEWQCLSRTGYQMKIRFDEVAVAIPSDGRQNLSGTLDFELTGSEFKERIVQSARYYSAGNRKISFGIAGRDSYNHGFREVILAFGPENQVTRAELVHINFTGRNLFELSCHAISAI